MMYNVFKVLISVRAKLFFGFLSMAVIISLLGGFAFVSLSNAGEVVEDTFDRPLMAINFARSASQVFSQVEIESLARRVSSESGNSAKISNLLETFTSDLEVAKERSISEKAEPFFDDVTQLTQDWTALLVTTAPEGAESVYIKADSIADQIAENLDIIVELQTNESFRNREMSILKMEKTKRYSFWAAWAAFFLTVILSSWIAVTIINPLKAAASAARKISAGNFDVDIPPGGEDETGALLKTMSAMQRNIRDRMSKEQNLRALAQHRLAESLENSKDAILLTDNEGRIIVANDQMRQMFPAIASVDLIHLPYKNFFHHSGMPKNDACEFFESDFEIHFGDGRWARINASDTQEGGRLFIWSDISQSKDDNERLRQARDQAQAADKAKTLFLAAMSHELRTPLNAVIGFSDIIADQTMGEVGNNKYVEMASLISQSGAHLLNIVKDVLSIADGRDVADIEVSMQRVDLNDVVAFCVKNIHSEAAEKSVSLIWQAAMEPLYVKGDPLRLQQVCLNLLSNAVKFNAEGGLVKVVIRPWQDAQCRIDIIDNGIGISSEDISRITEPFVQVDNGYTRKYEGAGLGLSIVKKMLDLHGGKLLIQSELGKGTAMSVVLPQLNTIQPFIGKAA